MCGKTFFIGAHATSTFSDLDIAVEFSLNLSAIYTKSCAQSFQPIFGRFTIFESNFAKIVAAPNDENETAYRI